LISFLAAEVLCLRETVMDDNVPLDRVQTPAPRPKRAPPKKPFWERVKKHWALTALTIVTGTLGALHYAPGALETVRHVLKPVILWIMGA